MMKLLTIVACSALFAAPTIAQADQHATHHPAQAAATSPAAQLPMAGPSMMSGDMNHHHAMMHGPGGMMADGGMHRGKHQCPPQARNGRHARHRHCKVRHH